MKVLLLSGSNSRNSGGLYNSVRSLGQSLYKIARTEPIILAHSDEYSDQDLAAYAPLPIWEYKIQGPAKLAYSPDLMIKIKEFEPDIIHPQCIWMLTSYVTLRYFSKYNTPYIISPRGMLDKWIINNNKWKKKLAIILYERRHLKNAACLHALALAEYHSIRDFGCKNPIAIIPNGVNLPALIEHNRQIAPEWAVDDRKILLFLSRIHPKKGIEALLKGWSQSGVGKKNWKLVIAGVSKDATYTIALEQLKDELELKKDVFFIGPQFHNDKSICFHFANAFILPSFSEGLPMAILEAWSYQLPVIMTEACNIPEGFECEAAIKILPEANSIAHSLNLLFSKTLEERIEMGKNGFELVKNKFTWQAVAEQMRQVYQWILNKSAAPSCIRFD